MSSPKPEVTNAHPTPSTPYHASCQCGNTKFTLPPTAIPTKTLHRCNCTSCVRGPTLHQIPDAHSIVLLSTPASVASPSHAPVEADLGQYKKEGSPATFFFCTTCGTRVYQRSFVEQLGGDTVWVNAGCVEGVDWSAFTVEQYWDGKNDEWEKGPAKTPYVGGFP